MIGILITARMGSSRLEAKHLTVANGRPLIWWLCARLERAFRSQLAAGTVKLIIATSVRPENRAFIDAVRGLPVAVYFGSDNNIPLRHLECAKEHGCAGIITVDGDDILCSTRGAVMLFDAMRDGAGAGADADLFEVGGLPLGMNPGGSTIEYLQKCVDASRAQRLETGWGRIFVNPRRRQFKLADYDPKGELRFTLDYPEDAKFFQAIIEELRDRVLDIEDEDLIQFVQGKELFKLNGHLNEKYWANFLAEKDKEAKESARRADDDEAADGRR